MVREKNPFRIASSARCVLNVRDITLANGRVWEVASIGDHGRPGVSSDPDIEFKGRDLAGSRFGEDRVVIRTSIARVTENSAHVRLVNDVTEIRCTISGIHGDEHETILGAGELQKNPFCATCCPYSNSVAGA